MFLHKRTRRDRKARSQGELRRRLVHSINRIPGVERLEHRHLLATLTVNTNLDQVNDGDGVLSLREAMLIANDSSGGTSFDGVSSTDVIDEVVIDSALVGVADTFVLNGTQLPNVIEQLTINGAVTGGRITIDGDQSSRILSNTSHLFLTNLNLINGRVVDEDGGAILNSGPTLSAGSVTIRNSVAVNGNGGAIATSQGGVVLQASLINNDAVDGGGLYLGGGNVIASGNHNIEDNVASRNGGGIFVASGAGLTLGTTVRLIDNTAQGAEVGQGGGGIHSAGGSVSINAAVFSGNRANGASGSGGGILIAGGGIAIVNRATFSGNTASRAGGGIEVIDSRLELNLSTLDSNTTGDAPGNGGGIHLTGASEVDIIDSTITANRASNEGGGLWNSGTGTLTVTNSTISANQADGVTGGGGIFNRPGGIVNVDSGTITLNRALAGPGDGIASPSGGVTLRNTIVAQNPGASTEDNLSGSIISDDFNLIGDADNGVLSGSVLHTIFAADALLLPLSNNGGLTRTHLPAAGSPAIGFGSTDLADDQRGVNRPQGYADDIGAVEASLNGVVVDAQGGIGDGLADEFLIVNDDQGITGDILVYVNTQLVFSLPKSTTGQILVRGSTDDDTLTVDNSNGLVGAAIIFDGDGVSQPANVETPVAPGGLDLLRLVGTTSTSTTYNPGSTVDAGAVYQERNEVVQRVQFFGLEPIQVVGTGAGDTLNVASTPLGIGFPQALNADNTINYGPGPNSDDLLHPVFAGDQTGLITVDGFESLEFSGFGTLNIDAGSGSDLVHLNHSGNPTDLAAINVEGGDPTSDADRVIINGTTAADAILVDSLTTDGARIQGAQSADVVVSAIEGVTIHGQGGADSLTVTTPAGSELVQYLPGLVADSGSILSQSLSPGGSNLLPVSFQNLGAGAEVQLADADDARADVLAVDASVHSDRVTVDVNGDVTITNLVGTAITPTILTPGVVQLILRGLDGDDSFDVAGDHPFTGQPGIVIEGSNPDGGSDTLNFVGSGAGSVTLDLAAQTITEQGFAPVAFVGVERVNIEANAALNVLGTDDNDSFDVTPTGAGNDGTLKHSGSASTFRYSNAAAVAIDGALGGSDHINIFGNEAANQIIATADSIAVDGSSVTLAGGLESLAILAAGGNDTVDLTELVIAAAITVRGESGDDTLIGSAQVDQLYGGDGNDVLVGRGGADFQYGEEGNDLFGNLTLTPDGQADDGGADQNFGGGGFDNFVWEPGDGTDFNNGGDDGSDIFRFFGRDLADTFTLRSGGTPTHFNALFNAVVIDNHGIEDVIVDPLGENDTILVQDLYATEVVNITINAGGGGESITVQGRSVADDLVVSAPANNRVTLRGLSYDINVTGSSLDDTLTIESGDGNDSIEVVAGVEAILNTVLLGGRGNDVLLGAFQTADGGDGNDVIRGGDNDNTILGGAGEDTLVGGNGIDTIDGGNDFDTILVEGTSGADVIDVFQASPTELRHTVNGNLQVDTLVASSVEQTTVVAGAGADLIRINWLDAHGVNAAIDSLRMTVDGGSDATSDRLVIVDDGDNDLVLYRKGHTDGSGTVQVGPGNAEALLSVFSGIETINFVDETGAPIVNDPAGPQLVVFKHDPFETNDDRFTATFLGGGATINVDPTIDPGALTNPFGDGFDLPGDHDFYRLVATATGVLDFQVYFRQVGELASGRPGLPGDGNLDINVRDSQGNVVANFGTNDGNDDERVRIPVVQGQTYYLEVFGNGESVNVYSLLLANEAPPVPYALELDDNPINGQTNPPGTQTDTSDTGRSQFDNHTYDNTPTIFFRLDDGIFLHDLPGNGVDGNPPDELIPIPFQAGVAQPTLPGFAIAIFDEGNTPPQTGTAPQTPLGFAVAVGGQEGVYAFTVPDNIPLSEGSHFLTARVQMIDPAVAQRTGFGARSLPLEIVVDRTAPEVAFGLAAVPGDGLHPDSDSGDLFLSQTLADSITNDLTPTLFGRAEANSIVRAFLDLDDSGDLNAGDLLIGQTVATPYDGTEQLETPLNPDEPGGQWELTSTVSMNDPRVVEALGRDGVRRILVTAEDVAGNISVADEASEIIELFIDTQGPRVDGVFITEFEDFNLFTLKPETPQPTPAVNSLTIRVIDLPDRIAPFLYPAISNVPPLAPIVLIGDHTGVIAIETILYLDISSGPGIAEGEIVMTFSEPLPDDRYTLTLRDNIIDPAGNQLDGENNASEPIGDPFFPTGDVIPGGDFIARFTVDSRPEIATWSQGVAYADINGNLVWDPEGQDNDATNRDFVFNFGEVTDAYFTGNFASNALPGNDGVLGSLDDVAINPNQTRSSGFDKLGAYGAFNGQYQFFLDTNDDGVGDLVGSMAFQVNAIPVAGNFFFSEADANAVFDGQRPRDEIGAFDGQNWYLDVDGNNQIDADERFPTSMRGIPVVGDFNGDGFDDLATYNNDSGLFFFDLDGDFTVDDQLFFGFSGFGERPVVGDVNLDGIDDLVMWVPRQEGQLPKEAGEFHYLISDRRHELPEDPEDPEFGFDELRLASVLFDSYSPAPLGNDLVAQFGDDFALPLLGNFDPPVDGNSSGASFPGSLTNELNPLDTTLDGKVTARDALVVINALGRIDFNVNANANPLRTVASLGGFRLDASQDGTISSLDALRIINGLARESSQAESESLFQSASDWAGLADRALTDLDDDQDDVLDLLALESRQIF